MKGKVSDFRLCYACVFLDFFAICKGHLLCGTSDLRARIWAKIM